MYKNLLLLALACLLWPTTALLAQGTLYGLIADDNGETLIGATVVEKGHESNGVVTDFNGEYRLKLRGAPPQTIVVSFIGYQNSTRTVNVASGTEKQDFILSTSAIDLDEAVVVARAQRDKEPVLRAIQMNEIKTMDFISKEQISRTGDSNVDDAMKRVTGVSTVAGFITVRGLADRYVKTTINGGRIPTLDPLTNNIKLDMFPTALIDNVIIYKTQSPDLPADWTGAYISIETKDYPEELFVNIKTSVGFNRNSTFKDVVTGNTGPTDWLGYDNGYRDIDHGQYAGVAGWPTLYEQFELMGLRDEMDALGISEEHVNAQLSGDPNTEYGMLYANLMFAELGLIPPSAYNTRNAYDQAYAVLANREGEMWQEHNAMINQPRINFNQSLPNNWIHGYEKALPDFSQDIVIGNQINFLGRPLGLIAGFKYKQGLDYDPDIALLDYIDIDLEPPYRIEFINDRSQSIKTNEWSALMNVSYKLSPNNSLTFTYMPNFSGSNNTIIDFGQSSNNNDISDNNYTHRQLYEERKQNIYQLATTHYLPVLKTKIDLKLSYTDGESSIPDFKQLEYYVLDTTTQIRDQLDQYPYINPEDKFFRFWGDNGEDPIRAFRYLNQNIIDALASVEIQLSNKPGLVRKLKFGGVYINEIRDNDNYNYTLNLANSVLTQRLKDFSFNDPQQIFNLNVFDLDQNGNVDARYAQQDYNSYHTIGRGTIYAGFIMLDYSFLQRFRFGGGVRLEYTDFLTDVRDYYERGLPTNHVNRTLDIREFNTGTTNAASILGNFLNPGSLESLDYLPSASLVYKLIDNQKAAMNVRLNYSKTLGRPSLRELSTLLVEDIELNNAWVGGNPSLKIAKIDNYDIRIETYFASGEYVSASVFYKEFKNHIELSSSGSFYGWNNADEGKLIGIELEAKKRLVKNMAIAANLTLVNSVSKGIDIDPTTKLPFPFKRPMYGQAPYIVNAILDYHSEKLGFATALSYNVQGHKIAQTGFFGLRDKYEMPRHIVDLKMAKSIGKRFGVEFRMRNMLYDLGQAFGFANDVPTSVRWAYEVDGNFDYTFKEYNYGTDYIFSVVYNL